MPAPTLCRSTLLDSPLAQVGGGVAERADAGQHDPVARLDHAGIVGDATPVHARVLEALLTLRRLPIR